MVLIRAACERRAVPWKNGGGLTREVAAHPPGSDLGSFGWRVSIAEVRAAGPFSSFPDVDRCMAVLAGSLRLEIAGAASLQLTPEAAPLCFAGEAAAYAEPLGAAVTDLNVMTRRAHYRAQLSRHALPHATTFALGAGTTVLVALAELALRAADGHWRLVALDAAVLTGVARCELAPAAAGGQQSAVYLADIRTVTRPR